MIISHKYRFIFLKTAKTAGTSIERALKPFCGPDDVFTGYGTRADAFNDRRGLGRMGVYVPGEIRRRVPQIYGFYPHMPASQVRSMVGRDIWDSYFKFCVERNPWDRQVSLFAYRHRRRAQVDFQTFLTSPLHRLSHSVRLDNWSVYTVGNEVVVDQVLRFENIADEFAALCGRLRIGTITLPEANVSRRDERGVYRHYYCERTRDIVARWYRNEIDAFGYEF